MKFENGITIIGNGNVAWHIGTIFREHSIRINAFAGRNKKNIDEISHFFGVPGVISYDQIPTDTDLILICVSDSALPEIIRNIGSTSTPIAHTAGSVPLEVLGDFPMAGVFYPFQTFTKGIYCESSADFPVCIEASCQSMADLLTSLASRITKKIAYLNTDQRRKLHLAGIVANNFSNYLYSLAFNYLRKNRIDPQLLLPIIKETARKLESEEPEKVQTGPAVRGNEEIIRNHIELLSDNPTLKELYERLSKGIRDFYNKNNE